MPAGSQHVILNRYQRQLNVAISLPKALIEDQVVNLHIELPDYEKGNINIIYSSPKRLCTYIIHQLLKNRPTAFWVLDEAHNPS